MFKNTNETFSGCKKVELFYSQMHFLLVFVRIRKESLFSKTSKKRVSTGRSQGVKKFKKSPSSISLIFVFLTAFIDTRFLLVFFSKYHHTSVLGVILTFFPHFLPLRSTLLSKTSKKRVSINAVKNTKMRENEGIFIFTHERSCFFFPHLLFFGKSSIFMSYTERSPILKKK